MLAGAYYTRTADLDLMSELWPAITAALRWIDVYGDVDGDGFVEARPRGAGPAHHSWKSSPDAVFHSDGRLATGPLAMCEVQGYVYAARLGAARIARSLGETPRAIALVESAQALQARFNTAFWCNDIESYALALDGDKQPCRVRTSNPGHCLYTGIAHAERARQIIAGLGDEHFFSGWGVRSVGESELRYNPMSYHNGSVWPHDNALIAAGAARYDDKTFALRILNAQFEAARHFDLLRLPELFCGFRRKGREAPLHFPVACSPHSVLRGRHVPAAPERARHQHRCARSPDRARASGGARWVRRDLREEPRGAGCIGGFHRTPPWRVGERQRGEKGRESGPGDPELMGNPMSCQA